jgi:REP element-mobilizing transposase RayT
VTLRARAGLPSLRSQRAFAALGRALSLSSRGAFRVLHFSAQTDHLHLIVEADSRRALGRGVQGLAGRCARAVNKAWERHGAVWAHRFHARPLRTPTEVRHALAYVLLNFRKHLRAAPSIDPRSSGRWFDGWRDPPATATLPGTLSRPRTWLASVGWQRGGGPIDVREVPGRS